ncbi:hypothetical protein [Sulfobacillus thermosulfidooxidans]|uniref:hypothetical protein n=1 Tax=Sulfobacillus thermosulfidooxidans TaxID=28034 RepID=UPI0006B48323|nr:hypothetical protein [Sulfobacillus thermosulfidooxidans]
MVLEWSVYRSIPPQGDRCCIATGSDPVHPGESPVERVMSLIERWTHHAAIPEQTSPTSWAYYGDHGTDHDDVVVFAKIIE